MKILVTGGAGYVGSHTVDELVRQGYEVVVVDNLSMGHIEAVHPQAEFIEGDLLNQDFVFSLFDQYQFAGIFHFASHTMVGESVEKPWLYLRNNILASSYLLEAATRHGTDRFILSSTANLFDKPKQMPIVPDEDVIPGSPYGESKAMIERQLHWMNQLYGLRYCCLRYFNAAGAHPEGHIGEDHTPESHIIPLILQVALGQREKITIFGDDYPTPDGTCIRDYVHVTDLATAHLLAFEALQEHPVMKFNLGNGKGYSIMELIEIARKITGHPIPVQIGERRSGDPAELIADSTAIRDQLGWNPEFGELHQIVETAWNWHKSHPRGYQTTE